VKLIINKHMGARTASQPFSILERIDVGETEETLFLDADTEAFSILERIDVGETSCAP